MLKSVACLAVAHLDHDPLIGAVVVQEIQERRRHGIGAVEGLGLHEIQIVGRAMIFRKSALNTTQEAARLGERVPTWVHHELWVLMIASL
jgi:hypothetical protein